MAQNVNLGNLGNIVTVNSSANSVNFTTSAISFGNSTVNTIINSTSFSSTSNNTLNVGEVSAANVVSNAQLQSNLSNYQTTAGLSANVATLTANNTSFVGSVSAANVVSNAQLSSNLANYQTTAGLSANVLTLIANNTSFVGTVSAANVVSNAQLSSNLANYQTTAGLSSNVATLTANNSTYLNDQLATYYTNATNISTGTIAEARLPYRLNQNLTTTNNVTFANIALTGGTLSTLPVNSNDIVNKQYADAIATGINFHQAVRLASPVGGTFTGVTYYNGPSSNGVGATLTKTSGGNSALILDGVTVAYQDRVLIKAESPGNTVWNGIYSVTNTGSGSYAWVLTRAYDYDQVGSGTNEIDQGDLIYVTAGATGAGTSWVEHDVVTNIGVDPITFVQFSSKALYALTDGTGLYYSVGGAYDGSVASTLAVNTAYIGTLTANNAAYLGGTVASGYQTTAGLSGNVATLTSNNTSFVGSVSAANVVSNAQLVANLSNYQTTAGLSANVATLTANNANNLNGKTEANLNVNNALTANNSSYLGGNTASDLRGYSDTKAGNAYSNAISYSGNAALAYANAVSTAATDASTKAGTAYSNAIAYSGNSALAYANAIAYSGNAALAYSNAIAYSGNAALAYANAVSAAATDASTKAGTAYSNAIAYSGNAAAAYANAVSTAATDASTKAGTAYSNAVAAIAVSTANNANYLGTVAAANYLTNSGAYTISGVHTHTTNININNNKNLNFQTVNTSNYVAFIQQSDDNFVFYSTNTAGGQRPVFSIYANSITSNLSFAVRTNHAGGIRIPAGQTILDSLDSQGTAGQVLTSNGTGNVYWSTVTSGSSYTFSTGLTNTSGTITVNSSYIATISANNASYLGGTVAASYQLNSTLAANVATMAANSSTYANSSVTNTFTVGTASYFVANGNFGVRTSTPSKPFSVLGSDHDPVIITNSSNTNWNRIIYQKGNRTWTMGQDNGTSFVLADETAALYRILVDLNGNVGIGLSNPAYKLDVTGDIRASANIYGTLATTSQPNITANNSSYLGGTAAASYALTSYINRTYALPNVLASASWIKLGTFTAGQGGNHCFIKVVTSVGYNAVTAQQNEVYIHFSTSNGVSVDANGFAGFTQFYITNSTGIAYNVKVVGNAAGVSATSYDIWFYQAGSYNGNGSFYTVEINNNNTWTNIATTGSDPGVASSTIGVGSNQFYVQSPTYLQGNVVLGSSSVAVGLQANGGYGTAGQLLTSNGTATYWSTVSAPSYTFSTGLVNTSGTVTVNASYIATISANNASYLGGTAAANYLRTDSSKDITEYVSLRFGSANQSDGNDGKIGAGLFSNGLNIVGTQTQTGNGREISYYGKLYDRSALGASILGALTTGNTVTVGTASYFVANGNIGVGTSSPSYKLQVVNGSIYQSQSDASMARIGLSNSNREWTISNYGTSYSPNGGFIIADETAAAVRLVINTSGNVGIACTSPSYILDTVGTGRFSKLLAGSITQTATDTSGIRTNADIYMDAAVSTLAYNIYYDGGWKYRNTGAGFAWRSDGTSVMQLFTAVSGTGGTSATPSAPVSFAANGNIGVGTSSPATKLNIYSSTAQNDAIGFVQIENPTASNSVNASYTAKNYSGTSQFMQWENYGVRIGSRIKTNSGAGAVVFTYGNDLEGMRIDSSGNVNIGGSTDAGNALRYFDVYNTNTGASAGSIIRLITSNTAGTGTTSVDIFKYKTGGFFINNNETNSAAFTAFTVGASERMRIDSSGNLGIGTTSPGQKLSVLSTGMISYFNSTTTDGYIRVDETGGSINILGGLSGVGFVGTASNYPFTIRTNNAERMRIDSSGSVGIGTSSPIRKFHIQDGTTGAEMSLTGSSATGTAFFNISDTAGSNGGGWNFTLRGLGTAGTVGLNLNSVNVYAATTYFAGDVRAYRSASTTTGVYYFSQSNDKYIYYDGTNFTISGGYVYNPTSFRAPIFYDSDNTAYYVDPAGTTKLGVIVTDSYLYFGSQTGSVNTTSTPMLYADVTNMVIKPGSGNGFLYFQDYSGTTRSQYNFGYGDWYMHYMYDKDNTGYYLDINGTSYLGVVTADRFYTGYDSGVTNSFSCSNWFRSNGSSGWFNDTYGGGINMSDSTWVRVYNNKQFYSQNFIQSDSSVRAPVFYDSNDTSYYMDPNNTSRTNIEWANTFRSQDNWWLDSAGNQRMLWVSADHNYYKTNSYHVFRKMDNTDLCYIASDGNIWMGTYRDWLSTQIRSAIFYDQNDTGYYCDPNSTSRFVRTNINTNEWNYSSEGWVRQYYNYGNSTINRGGSTGQWTFEFQNHNDGSTRWLMAHAGDFYAAGNITAYWSDKRLKKNIEKISDWKEILAGINGYRFQWNDIGKRMLSKENDEVDVGLIAQEVKAVYPHGAAIQMLQYKKQNPDGTLEPKDDIDYDPENPYLTVREDKLIPVLVEALKAHDAEIEELKEKIRKLENILSFMS